MSKQLDAAVGQRMDRGRFLAAAIPAIAVAGAIGTPTASHADVTVRPLSVAQVRGTAGLDRFASALGVTGPTRNLVAVAVPQAHASRVTRKIDAMIAAGNHIARLPYTYGGGHGSFTSDGYDCSGSVSYVLHAAGLLSTPEDSSGLESFGEPGPGKHVTIYANGGHALMTIDGRRFDTIALQETGTRWSRSIGDTSGYVVRHPRGL